jgi:ribonuclease P protein component
MPTRSKDPFRCKAARHRLKRRIRSAVAEEIRHLADGTEFIFSFMPTETLTNRRFQAYQDLMNEIVMELAREMRK